MFSCTTAARPQQTQEPYSSVLTVHTQFVLATVMGHSSYQGTNPPPPFKSLHSLIFNCLSIVGRRGPKQTDPTSFIPWSGKLDSQSFLPTRLQNSTALSDVSTWGTSTSQSRFRWKALSQWTIVPYQCGVGQWNSYVCKHVPHSTALFLHQSYCVRAHVSNVHVDTKNWHCVIFHYF